MPPQRTTSTSSMLSAPAHIAAITVAGFGAGFADPDLIRGLPIWNLLGQQRRQGGLFSQRHHRHQPAAHDTRLPSSNTAESAIKLCDTCTGSAFRGLVRLLCGNSNHPSSQGTFLTSTPHGHQHPSVDRG